MNKLKYYVYSYIKYLFFQFVSKNIRMLYKLQVNSYIYKLIKIYDPFKLTGTV